MSNLSFVRHVGDGITTQFALSINGENMGYFRISDIHGYVDDKEVPIVIEPSSPHIVNIVPAPKDGADILLRREMPIKKPYADFERGNNFGQRQVNNSFLQQLYLTQELLDGFMPLGYYMKQNIDMGGHRAINAAKEVDKNDYVIKETTDILDERITGVEKSITAGNLIYRRVTFTAKEGQTRFDPNAIFGAIHNLFVNGVNQIEGEAYRNIDNRIIETVPLNEGDRVVAVIGQEPKFVDATPVDFRYVRYPYYATGGETAIKPLIDFKAVMSVYINGVHQTEDSAFYHDKTAKLVNLAEALVGGDEVILYLGEEPENAKPDIGDNIIVEAKPSGVKGVLSWWMQKLVDFGKNLVTSRGSTTPRTLEDRFADVANVKDFGAVGDGITDDTTAVQSALSTGKNVYFPYGTYAVVNSIRPRSNQMVYGEGIIKGINPESPNIVLVRMENLFRVTWLVDVDMNQSESTVAADNKIRYGIFISNCRSVYIGGGVTISNTRVGYPVYVTGLSYNGIDPTTKGSKYIYIDGLRVDGLPTDDADGGNVNELIFRSDFYTLSDGGKYFGGSNALKLSDYTVDPDKTYPATTEGITMTNCTLKNCDRIGVLNVKDAIFANNTLSRFGYRGYNCSPTVEGIHINGGSIDGAFGASVNFSYGSKNCSARNLFVNPVKYNKDFSGYGEGSTFRVNYGTTDCYFSHIVGMGAIKRQAWIVGCKRIRFNEISLRQHSDGGSQSSLVISAGVNVHNVTYQVEDIQVTNSDMESEIGVVLNGDFSSTASYAENSVILKDCIFNAKTTLVSCLNTGQPDITGAMSAYNCVFNGGYRAFVGFNEGHLYADVGNSWGDSGTANFSLAKVALKTLPYDLPLGHTFAVVNGDPDVPSGASKQGVVETVKLRREASYIKFVTQTYTEVGGAGVHAARFWKRHGSSGGNTWTPWYKYSYDNT